MKKKAEIARAERFKEVIGRNEKPLFMRNSSNEWVEMAWIDGYEIGFQAGKTMALSIHEECPSACGSCGDRIRLLRFD